MRIPTLLAALLLASCHAEDPSAAPSASVIPPSPAASVPIPSDDDPGLVREARGAADGSALPRLACLFSVESKGDGGEGSWELRIWRSGVRLESRESLHDTGEAWLGDAEGRVAGLERLFHGPRKCIEYGEGDLRVLGFHRSWDSIARVMDPNRLGGTLRRTGDAPPALGLPSEWWEGEAEGYRMRVRWVPALSLPAEAERSRGGESLVLRLREVYALPAAPWSPPMATDYDRVEFADLGDRHGDPFFRQFQHGGGGEVRGDGYDTHDHR